MKKTHLMHKDKDENLYGFKPDGIKVTEISMDEARLIAESKAKEKTTLEKIRDLENSITERNKQEAILGDEYAIALIQSICDQKKALRDQL